MAVPKYYEFYNAFLEYLSNGQVAKYNDCKEYVKQRMNLSEIQLSELSESGGHIWENRVGWCATYLKNAGLVAQPKREQYQITNYRCVTAALLCCKSRRTSASCFCTVRIVNRSASCDRMLNSSKPASCISRSISQKICSGERVPNESKRRWHHVYQQQ